MEGSFLSPPAKRPYQNAMQEDTKNLSNNKRRSKPPQEPLVVLRLLCPTAKVGGVIGKSGSIVKLFRQETGAKIHIEEPPAACDERVILILAPQSPKKTIIVKGSGEEEEEEHQVSPAQEALVKVFERVLDVEAETAGIFPPPGGVVSCRMLAESNQIGALMGKGGKTIEKIRKESGSRVRVLPPDQIPTCASSGDIVIQIMGDVLAVKKALMAISCCLQDNPPTDKAQKVGNKAVGVASHGSLPDPHVDPPHRSSLLSPSLGHTVDYASRNPSLPIVIDRISTLDPKKQQQVAFRLLCSNDIVGGVIGKGGNVVKALHNETGANISIGSPVSEAEDRVITVSAMETPESRFSPAQNATVRVFARCVEVAIEKGVHAGANKSGSVSARLLIQTNEVGCLMGKGGTIIQEMRKVTGTSIRIIAGDKVPKCASENEELVQIIGELSNVEDALFCITTKLRDNLFPNKMTSSTGSGSYASTFPEISPYGRAREPTSPGLYSSVGISRHIDRQTTLTRCMDHLGLSHGLDRPPSPQPWTSQNVGGLNLRNIDIGRGLTRGGLDFGSGGKSAIVTNTTVEIIVPEQIMGSVYGEHGNNLNRLRQISGAKVLLHDPRPGTSEAVVIISGTPDQTQAAQSLLQAFILSGQSSPESRKRLLL